MAEIKKKPALAVNRQVRGYLDISYFVSNVSLLAYGQLEAPVQSRESKIGSVPHRGKGAAGAAVPPKI